MMTPDDWRLAEYLMKKTYEERKKQGKLTMFETWEEASRAVRELLSVLILEPLLSLFNRFKKGA